MVIHLVRSEFYFNFCFLYFQLIFSSEYTKAMDTNYHKDHLACKNCDKKLIACRYILKEEHPYCIPCYQELFAHSCEECKKPIGPDYKVNSPEHFPFFNSPKPLGSLVSKGYGCSVVYPLVKVCSVVHCQCKKPIWPDYMVRAVPVWTIKGAWLANMCPKVCL